jgi:hypothetical protein
MLADTPPHYHAAIASDASQPAIAGCRQAIFIAAIIAFH